MGIDIPLGNQKNEGSPQKGQPFDILLAQLAFSNPMELPKIIESNMLNLDDNFFAFVDSKIAQAKDNEERENLSLLKDAVIDLKKTILKAGQAGVFGGGDEELMVGGFEPEAVALATYDKLIADLLAAADGGPAALTSAVEAAYDRLDMRFLERLSERLEGAGEADGAREALQGISSAIQSCMSERIQKASQALQTVLRAGTPEAMTRQLMLLNAKGGLDSNVIMLLEANIDQAGKAGAAPAVKVMTMLRERAMEFKDQSMPDEVRVIRQLLRTDGEAARRAILAEAFKPREAVFMADGKKTKTQAVDGRKFVKALATLMEKFGNVDDKFMDKLQSIAREAQAVATELFGTGERDVKSRQDDAWSKGAVSVWDLESLEETYETTGDQPPWYKPSSGGWDENGNMVIGGDNFKKKGTGKGEGGLIF